MDTIFDYIFRSYSLARQDEKIKIVRDGLEPLDFGPLGKINPINS